MDALRQHMADLHRTVKRPRSNADLGSAHARAHHRLHCNHFHEEDNAGKLIGPGSDRRRPSGWYTGLGVVMRDATALRCQPVDAAAAAVAALVLARLGPDRAEAYARRSRVLGRAR